MSDCPLFLLPSNQCSHCTGAKGIEEPFYERGIEITTRAEEEFELTDSGRKVRKEEWTADSDRTIGVVYNQEHPGKWARTQDVYDGHDGQVGNENLEMES